ncbi:hypothetical protein [Nakamurella endophytica]|uniref:Uncharacterized protein n=1 Tax=Nakamurella endophytica TaxID=1748367 RepID=A0A917TDJ1_9ACTN|nr:hypothetical protein [Nakamurella endophytica]GGM18726.1 hypothetical protein GCM10011594_43500 [Nakamurella endophytica]
MPFAWQNAKEALQTFAIERHFDFLGYAERDNFAAAALERFAANGQTERGTAVLHRTGTGWTTPRLSSTTMWQHRFITRGELLPGRLIERYQAIQTSPAPNVARRPSHGYVAISGIAPLGVSAVVAETSLDSWETSVTESGNFLVVVEAHWGEEARLFLAIASGDRVEATGGRL